MVVAFSVRGVAIYARTDTCSIGGSPQRGNPGQKPGRALSSTNSSFHVESSAKH